jgi:hypothetical protein
MFLVVISRLQLVILSILVVVSLLTTTKTTLGFSSSSSSSSLSSSLYKRGAGRRRRNHSYLYNNNAATAAVKSSNSQKPKTTTTAAVPTKFPKIITSRRNIIGSTSFSVWAAFMTTNNLFFATTNPAAASATSSYPTTTITTSTMSTGTNNNNDDSVFNDDNGTTTTTTIAYKTVALPIKEFGIEIPVACWYPTPTPTTIGIGIDSSSASTSTSIKYNYRISLRRIGQLLAKWDFIPDFISRDFALDPSISLSPSSTIRVVDGQNISIPPSAAASTTATTITTTTGGDGTKVVFLAHGFLGSRLDLAYIAEDLARQGFVCIAPEYPESLEASYPRLDGLSRTVINNNLLRCIQQQQQQQRDGSDSDSDASLFNMISKPIISYSAIGHSLGCSTVLQMGDNSWNRILMGSGKAPEIPSLSSSSSGNSNNSVGGRLLFISSINDGPVTKWSGGIKIPEGYTMLKESQLSSSSSSSSSGSTSNNDETNIQQQQQIIVIPDRAALVFDRQDAPNHISYLSANTNDAMLSFLSPLLPITNALGIPVLDFDKYMISRDSARTGNILKPLISNFLLSAKTK